MNKVLISIRPEWVAKILNGKKTIEVRKNVPKCGLPCEVYIYCSKGQTNLYWTGSKYATSNKQIEGSLNQTIVAVFTLNKVEKIDIPYPAFFYKIKNSCEIENKTCLDLMSLHHYLYDQTGYGWVIDNLEICMPPRKISLYGFKRPPQSWCYIKEKK